VKILLIYPWCLEARLQEEDAGIIPMGLYYIGAMLKKYGHTVDIVNLHGMEKFPEKIREMLVIQKPCVIGFSILNANRWGGIDVARMAKELDPSVKIVFGGVSATFLWDYFLKKFPEVDYTVMGEGEETFLKLVQYLEAGDAAGIGQLRGIGFRKNGQPLQNGPAEPVKDLDTLPDPSQYFTFQHIALTRGCPGNCTFCGSPQFWDRKVRFHSADYFVGQIERLYKRGVNFFFVSDDTFTLKKPLVIDICKKILECGLNITWAAISRVDCVDAEILRWMRRAGCIQISYGVESGSPEIRNFFNKNLKKDDIQNAFDLTRKYGIMARAYFIYGSPGENSATIQASIDLVNEIRPLGAIFYILDVFPGTRLYEIYRERFGIDDTIWDSRIEDILWFEHDPEISAEAVLSFGKTLRENFYRNLPQFAESLELADDPELYPFHADFLSRLAMTFIHGDYAAVAEISRKAETGEMLYRRALAYAPDHRAFWGLGMLLHQQGKTAESAEILAQGAARFPESEQLALCLGVCLMNQGKFQAATEHLRRFPYSADALRYLVQCCRATGDKVDEQEYLRKLSAMTPDRG